MALQPLSVPHLRLNYFAPATPRHPFIRTVRFDNINRRGICSAGARNFETEVQRRLPNYQPTSWSYEFLQSLKPCDKDEMLAKRAGVLEEEIRAAMNDRNAEPDAILLLIDDVQRLGLGHRFERDIGRALHRYVSGGDNKNRTLFTTSLAFRLLRQHGLEVSPDVFKAFMDDRGAFLDDMKDDIRGILSLYEASHLGFEGEEILEEARMFATEHLRGLDLADKIETDLLDQVKHSLELPLNRRMQWQEARWYIEAYSTRKDRNQRMLELAVVNFNAVQRTLQQDLQSMSRWWNGINLANTMTFARDRLMECFFWAVGIAYEPRFSNCRNGLTKVASLVTIIDDVYDVYGTLDELELFTSAVERWDVNALDGLPRYMKLCFLALYNTVHDMAYDSLKEHDENIIPYLANSWADLCKAFLQEAKWSHNKITPTFDEYLDNGWVSVSGAVFLAHAYFLCSPNMTKQELDSLEKYHDLLRWPSTIFRLCNDLATSSAELERGETANSILCYMLETGASEELARKHISKLIDSAWNKMNECRVRDSSFGKAFIQMAFNLARISHCTYEDGDSHGAPDGRSKKRVHSLIIEPIENIIQENPQGRGFVFI